VDAPNIVNLINREQILIDIAKAKKSSPDKIIAFLHWGEQYVRNPSKKQIDLADFLARNGVDLIIGSHPHVVQRMENYYDDDLGRDIVKVYSLGNFVSNQRDRYRDGGVMARITLTREKETVHISKAGYYLTWVYPKYVNGRKQWRILPASRFENNPGYFDQESFAKMQTFIKDSRSLLEEQNLNVYEYTFLSEDNSWEIR
jgi:poly-gamma-glutamate synthesis protein (capsule biosynthesis protein)